MPRSKINGIIIMNMVKMMAIMLLFIQARAAQTEEERVGRRAQNAAQHAQVKDKSNHDDEHGEDDGHHIVVHPGEGGPDRGREGRASSSGCSSTCRGQHMSKMKLSYCSNSFASILGKSEADLHWLPQGPDSVPIL